MADLQPDGLSFGTVFEYPQSITYPELRDWGESEGFEMVRNPEGEVRMGEGGVQIDGPGAVGENAEENIQILFNPQANIDGVGNSMFVTVKDDSGARFDKLQTYTESLWDWLESNGYDEDVAFLELILQTRVRASEHNFDAYFDDEHFDTVGEFGNPPVRGATARFQGDGDKGPGWFRLLIDSVGHPNPQIWLVKLTQRYDSVGDVDGDDIKENVLKTIEIAEVNDE